MRNTVEKSTFRLHLERILYTLAAFGSSDPIEAGQFQVKATVRGAMLAARRGAGGA